MNRKSFRIFLVCYAAYLFIYVARVNLSVAAPSLKELSILSTAQIGFLGSMFSVIYACGRLLTGIIGDRTAPWKMISLGLIFCGISNLLIGLFPPFQAILLFWGVNAFAQSMLWGAILRILSAIYPETVAKKRASYMGTAVAAGNLVGILLNTELINRWGAQWAFLIPGGITLVLSSLIIVSTNKIIPVSADQHASLPTQVLRHRTLRQMLAPAMIHGVMKDNISLWMTVYVMERFGVDLEQSSYYILLIPLVGMLGRFLAPVLFKAAHGKENKLILWSFLLCAAAAALLVLAPGSAMIAVVFLSLIYFAVSVINACLLAFFPIQFQSTGQVASVSGMMDFATYLGTGLSAMVFGLMIDQYGFESMFLTWAVLSAAAIPLMISRKKGKEK